MKCPECNHENPAGARFCMECGTKLENVCPQCGAKLPPEAKFCMECGAKLTDQAVSVDVKASVPKLEDVHARLQRSMPKSLAAQIQADAGEGENRILSILFADVSGSVAVTENMEPEDAAELISECLKVMVDVILKYEGTINRFLGDSVLTFFGIPETHENDAERAVLAALEIREAVTRLNLNISTGINTGMVYVGAIGPDSHSEFTAMGTAVNLAARLEKEAESGQILVGQATYRLTRRAFEYASLQPVALKGITEPVNVYEVIKALPRPEKIRGIEGLRAEMIGREREFADLKDSVDELLSGRGQIVSIIGEAGVGKSRLVTEIRDYLGSRQGDGTDSLRCEASGLKSQVSGLVSILEGRCVSIGESIGYWVFIDMLRGYLGFSEDDTPADLQEKIVTRMQDLFPRRWKEIAPYIGNLLSVKSTEWDDKIRYLPPEQIKQQTFFVLRDVFFALSQQKPLLLIFEDLHWADTLSLDMINLLMDDLTRSPLMLLCVYRPYKEHRSWRISAQASAKCLDRYKEITLRPLNDQESRRLVGALLAIENLPESIRESILQKAEGNPFFVEEVIRSLIENGVVYQDRERWVAKAEIKDIAVPDTIQSVIMSRIDRLEDEARYVLQSASVIGRLFRHRLLGYITQQEQKLDEYLWKLEERDLVYEERAVPELEYSFRHALTQETAYNTILSRRRKEFHRKVAEGYEALYSSRLEECYEELAYHYSRSDNRQKAFEYLIKAGHKSMEAFANEEAIKYYNQALELVDDLQVETALLPQIYLSLAEIHMALTKNEEVLEYCHKALEYATGKRQRARIYGTIGVAYERMYRFDLALEYWNMGIAELGDDTECLEMAMICEGLVWFNIFRGEPEDAIGFAQRGLRILEGAEQYFEANYLYISLITPLILLGDMDAAFECAGKSMEVAQTSGNAHLIGHSNTWLGFAHAQDGDNDIAIRLLEEAEDIFRKIGDRFLLGHVYSFLWPVYYSMGEWDLAIECLEKHAEIPDHRDSPYLDGVFALSYLRKDDFGKAIQHSEKALGIHSYSTAIVEPLDVLERALIEIGKGEEFASHCTRIKEKRKDAFQDLKLRQWYLESKEPSGLFTQTAFVDEFDGPDLRPEWEWVSHRSDCRYSLSKEAGWLEIYAPPGSDLFTTWPRNFYAPRLLRKISGDFSVETRLKAASDNMPSRGGILIWKDKQNFIRFERTAYVEGGVKLSGNIQDSYGCFGRGILTADIMYLRLERLGDRLSTYCSGDGESWYTCGEVSFPAEDPIHVGLHAIGGIGFHSFTRRKFTATATRFDYFRVLRRKR